MAESMMTFEISKIGHRHPSLVIKIIWFQIPSPTFLFCVNCTAFLSVLSKPSSAMGNACGYILLFPFVTLFLMVQLGMTWFKQDFSLSYIKKSSIYSQWYHLFHIEILIYHIREGAFLVGKRLWKTSIHMLGFAFKSELSSILIGHFFLNQSKSR